jgi:hypothetical protein
LVLSLSSRWIKETAIIFYFKNRLSSTLLVYRSCIHTIVLCSFCINTFWYLGI